MKFAVGLPTERVEQAEEFLTMDSVMRLARAAETAGFDAVSVTDHPFPQDEWMGLGGHHALDPFVPLSFAAAATTRLRLLTHILVLPYRNPFMTAKSVLSLDVLSGGRIILGAASGYLQPEFDALGADFERRNETADEAILAMKAAWSTPGLTMEGHGFSAKGHTMLPPPSQKPHPPIWIGGNAKRAIRRAVELADGWIPMANPSQGAWIRRSPAIDSNDDLKDRIAYAREHAASVGRTAPLEICYGLTGSRRFNSPDFDLGLFLNKANVLKELGITYMTVGLGRQNTSKMEEDILAFGEQVIPQV